MFSDDLRKEPQGQDGKHPVVAPSCYVQRAGRGGLGVGAVRSYITAHRVWISCENHMHLKQCLKSVEALGSSLLSRTCKTSGMPLPLTLPLCKSHRLLPGG